MLRKKHIVTTSAIIALILSSAVSVQANELDTFDLHNDEPIESEVTEETENHSQIEIQEVEPTNPTKEMPPQNTEELSDEIHQQFNQIMERLEHLLNENQKELLDPFFEETTDNELLQQAIVYHEENQFEQAEKFYKDFLSQELSSEELGVFINNLIKAVSNEISLSEVNFNEEISQDEKSKEYEPESIADEKDSENTQDTEIIQDSKTIQNDEVLDETDERTVSSEETQMFVPMMVSLVPSADELYESIVNAKYAFKAWDDAMLFEELYPQDSRLQEAIDTAANYMLNQAIKNHQNNDYTKASEIYNKILANESVNTNIHNVVKNLTTQSVASANISTADELYHSIMTAQYAYQAWEDALLLKKLYPQDSRVQEAIDTAAGYMLRQGVKSHERKDYDNAVSIYNRILAGGISNFLAEPATAYLNQAVENQPLITADALYDSVQNAKFAYVAWDEALYMKSAFPSDPRVQEVIDTAAGYMLRQGIKSHERKDYANAISIYTRILDGGISSYLSEPTKVYLNQAASNQNIVTADNLYESVKNAKYAYVAWDEALYMKSTFPNDPRVQEVIDTAAGYMLRQGVISHERKDYDNAVSIYTRILAGGISNYLAEPATAYLNQATDSQPLITADALYDSVQNAKYAYVAWDEALYMKNAFPSDSRVQITLDTAAGYMLRQGIKSHERKDFDNAVSIYTRILAGGISNYLAEPANAYLNQANEKQTIVTADDLYNSVQNAKYAYVAWDEALYMKNAFPSDLRVQEVLDTAAGYMLNQAIKSHTRNDYQSAMETYEKIFGEPSVSNYIRTRAESYHYLANNNYSLSNVIVRNTSYNISIEDFISIQMTRQPQIWDTSTSSKNPWRNATRSETARYADPNRVNHNSEYLQFLMLSGSSGITANDLNEELKNAGILSGLGSVFQKASAESNVNELYLIAHALLETGNGTSKLATGIEVNGKTVYNMFGIGAIDKDANKYGSEKAYEMGWFTPEEAILGGAKWIAQNYINNPVYKQNTLYKMRWNPARPGLHQYATDVAWAYNQTKSLNSMVELTQKYNGILNFDVPNFN